MIELPNYELPEDSHVTMRSDQAWQLLDEARAKYKEQGGSSVLKLALMDAASQLIHACEFNRIVTVPKSIKSALIELACEETPASQGNIIMLDQSQITESYKSDDLPLSA
jgi:hypothetical protein